MKYLSCDLRALALMRISIAAVVLIDLAIRVSDLEAFYTNSGVAPLPMMYEHMWNNYYFSFHAVSGLWQIQGLLFLFASFCAVMVLIGYRTKLFTILSWLMLVSLHNRNIIILQGGDDLLRMVLFWGMFIPWGVRYSCDSLLSRDTDDRPGKTLVSVATIAYFLQLSYIYTGSALLKGPEWHTDFTAVYYAFSLDQIAYPLTKYYYYYPLLLKKLTAIAWYFELLLPILFIIPIKHGLFRLVAVLSIIFFHLFNSLHLFIGLFPLIGCCTVIGLTPSFVFEKLEPKFSKLKNRVATSFYGWAKIIALFIPWIKPTYTQNKCLKNLTIATLVFLVVFVFDWNLSNLAIVKSKMPEHLRFIGYTLRLDQNWGMFAPGVFKDDGWYVLEGTTTDGKTISLLNSANVVSYKKPAKVVSMFKNDRQRKYSENFIFSYNEFLRGYFCTYFKRKWNENKANEKINELKITYVKEFTLPDYKYFKPCPVTLWQCSE